MTLEMALIFHKVFQMYSIQDGLLFSLLAIKHFCHFMALLSLNRLSVDHLPLGASRLFIMIGRGFLVCVRREQKVF